MVQQLWECEEHKRLCALAETLKAKHLRGLLSDAARSEALAVKTSGIFFDFSRQKVTPETIALLVELAKRREIPKKRDAMFAGEKINTTENRAVLHMALRSPKGAQPLIVDGEDAHLKVHEVLDRIASFSEAVRTGARKGHTGKELRDVICIGIGGSYLGPEFVFEALRTHPECAKLAEGRRLRFLANVDPIDVRRATEGLCPETTLIIVISKTFTTAETMLNARTLRQWLLKSLKDPQAVGKHMVAVSTNLAETGAFGILPENVFGFWDWVGGRFSVCSAVGCLPLALQYGFATVRQFLDGCWKMDEHFKTAPLERNIPFLMGALGVWNVTYLGYSNLAILPYCQALLRFAAHIQQLAMESNGKRVTREGTELPPTATSEIFFGEPGTNGQHSFYQLLHQGRAVPADFIGFCRSQVEIALPGEAVSNHDELMSNFFAQPDAFAIGKTTEECRKDGVAESLIPHKVLLRLLLPICDAEHVGLLLAAYEHRTAVQGFFWGLNSFDQWGVELGKVLAKDVRSVLEANRKATPAAEQLWVRLPSPSQTLLKFYLQNRAQATETEWGKRNIE